MQFLSTITPEGVSETAALIIVLVSFFTSLITGAFGLGGGLALLAAMSTVFPASAVVPVHGLAQLGSNFSRFYLLRTNTQWPIVLWFVIGAIVGSFFGAKIALGVSESVLRIGLAIFILITVWMPKPSSQFSGKWTFLGGGAISSFLTMFFGATGPLVAALLSATRLDRLQMVSTHAACLFAQHGIKSIAFGVLGFAYAEWAGLIVLIILAGFAGSFVGTRQLKKIPEGNFQVVFKLLLTCIAIYLLVMALVPKTN